MKILRTAAGSMPWISIARQFSKYGIEVVGVDCDRDAAGLHEFPGYVVPKATSPDFLVEFLKVVDKEQPDAIMPVLEEEMVILSKNRGSIKPLLLLPADEVVEACTQKRRTYAIFDRIGVPRPKETSGFPAIVKPNMGRGSAGIFKVNNQEELQEALSSVKDPIVQEYAYGEEFSIDILSDLQGNAVSIVPRKRLATESGISVRGITIYDSEIVDYCRKISKEFKLFGPSCVQCIKGAGLWFIEINLRFGGGSVLSMNADPEMIPILKELVKGKKPSPSNGFRQGLTMSRHYGDVFYESSVL